MNASRYAAIGLVAAATVWVLSGHLMPHNDSKSSAASRPSEAATETPFRVAVATAHVESHVYKLKLSGRTEADKKVMVTARTNGVLAELRVKRGQKVKQGEIVAVLSDEAREAQVARARALLEQRKAELGAKRKLIEQGTLPRLDLGNLEAQFKAAQATLAQAEAELERATITAPWPGIVTDVPAEVGQTLSSGKEIVQIVALDPMLAVVEISERKLAGIAIGKDADIRLIDGVTAHGHVRYVSKTASATTRTYRVEVEIKNTDGAIPDGITAEVTVPLDPVPAIKIPRSALTFSSSGQLGVRTVNDGGKVGFTPVTLIADGQRDMWVNGITDGTRVIVQGQDFVREGQTVTPISLDAATALR